MRLTRIALGLVVLSLVPLLAGADHPALATRLTLADMQKNANAIVGIPEVASAIGEGGTISLIDGTSNAGWHGTLTGGAVTLQEGADHDANGVMTMGRDAWLATVNGCDGENTAKLLLRGGYVGIDGKPAVRALANSLRTGAFDSRLGATAPAAGTPFPCKGYQTAPRAQDLFGVTPVLAIDLGDRTYVLESANGAIVGQLGPSYFYQNGAFGDAGGASYWMTQVSLGNLPIPAECAETGTGPAAMMALASCLAAEYTGGGR
ncbi:MAG TPA: hypothetical protein VM370_02560 [Candidatus Thermoplasmatota archaeon]|nr:hypothetical protein [Candidatus Thermoplasmatota archaeon]